MEKATRVVLLAVFVVATIARSAHRDILWVEEAYGMAAAAEVLRGKFLYRDIWFDKPPLYALVYLLWDVHSGWALRWAGALYVAMCSSLLYRFALELWGYREALLAGSFVAFYLTFGIPSAVMALAPDLLMVAPHIAAVYLAWKGAPFWSGVLAAIAFLVNAKGLWVLAACLLWQPAVGVLQVLAGFAAPNCLFAVALIASGAWSSYWHQVWEWGSVYARDTFIANPVWEALKRTANWAGFHATIVIGAIWWLRRDRRMLGWSVISLMAVAVGWRFFPRYYLQLLPVFALAGARGLMLMPRRLAIATVLLIIIPLARFGPRYVALLGGDQNWTDTAMNRGTQAAARLIAPQLDDTLLVWGYRPDLFLYTGLAAGTRFLDSQPLTGVIADRHLQSSRASAAEWAARNRAELVRTRPVWIADGLGPYNHELAIDQYEDLRGWLRQYRTVGRISGFVIYQLASTPDGAALPEER